MVSVANGWSMGTKFFRANEMNGFDLPHES